MCALNLHDCRASRTHTVHCPPPPARRTRPQSPPCGLRKGGWASSPHTARRLLNSLTNFRPHTNLLARPSLPGLNLSRAGPAEQHGQAAGGNRGRWPQPKAHEQQQEEKPEEQAEQEKHPGEEGSPPVRALHLPAFVSSAHAGRGKWRGRVLEQGACARASGLHTRAVCGSAVASTIVVVGC